MFRSTSLTWANGLKVLACAVGTLVLAATSQAAILYNPVVTVVGDGTNSLATGVGFTDSVYLLAHDAATQATPLATASYNNSSTVGTGQDLVVHSGQSQGQLSNNPALADAAGTGHLVAGGHIFSGGYDAQDNATAVVVFPTPNANRVVGYMTVGSNKLLSPTVVASVPSDSTGVNPPAATDAYYNSDIRGAVGTDSLTNLWTSGTNNGGGANGFLTAGFRYFYGSGVAAGQSNQLAQSNASGGFIENTRTIQIRTNPSNGQATIFGSSDTGVNIGISVADNISGSLPTNTTLTNIMVTSGTSSSTWGPYQFALFRDAGNANLPVITDANGSTTIGFNVAYISDNGSSNPGIEKWVYNGTNWTNAYTIRSSTDVTAGIGYSGLAAQLDAKTGKVILYATTDTGAPVGGSLVNTNTRLEQFADLLTGITGADGTTASGTAITLADKTNTLGANANMVFRGVALAPIPAGDFNFDGRLTAADIVPMEQAMTNPAGFESANGLSPADLATLGDVDGNSSFNNGDLQKLLADLQNGGVSNSAVPEPSTLVLGLLGTLSFAGVTIRRRKLAAAA